MQTVNHLPRLGRKGDQSAAPVGFIRPQAHQVFFDQAVHNPFNCCHIDRDQPTKLILRTLVNLGQTDERGELCGSQTVQGMGLKNRGMALARKPQKETYLLIENVIGRGLRSLRIRHDGPLLQSSGVQPGRENAAGITA